MLLASALAVIVFGPMLIEAGRAARNERAQRARGGIEPPDDVYHIMRIAYPAAFVSMIVAGFVRGMSPPPLLIAGGVVFLAAKGLKWWAILTLGPCWTFRVIVVPGASLVARGPYEYLRHPNYVAVFGELIAVALMTGTRIVGPIAIVGFGLLMLKRIAVEERALSNP